MSGYRQPINANTCQLFAASVDILPLPQIGARSLVLSVSIGGRSMINAVLVFLTFFAVPTALISDGGQWVAGVVLAGWVIYLVSASS